MAQSSSGARQKVREENKLFVGELVKDKALEETDFAGLKALGSGLKQGDSLVVEVLLESQTNFAYKVSLKQDPTKSVYAKITFERAVLNQDEYSPKYDLSRAVNEFAAIKKFAELYGSVEQAPVAEPYYCWDLPGEVPAKLSISEWCAADDHFATQFKEGQVDQRILTEVAEALGKLNMVPIEPDWNEGARECMISLHKVFKTIFGEFIKLPADDSDVCTEYCKELGLERLEELVDKMDEEYQNSRQVFCHNDPKQFSIMIHRNDPNQSWVLEDWEQTIKGRNGRDPGIFQAYTIACAYCHAVQGDKKKANGLLDSFMGFWGAYEDTLRKGGKDDDYLYDALKGSLGATMLYGLIAYYMLGLHHEGLPLEKVVDERAKKRALGSLGKTCLELGEIAYLGKLSELRLSELKMYIAIKIDEEISELLDYGEGHSVVSSRRRSKMKLAKVGSGSRLPTDKSLVKLAENRFAQKKQGGRASVYASLPKILDAPRRPSTSGTLEGRSSVYGTLAIPTDLLDLDDEDEDNREKKLEERASTYKSLDIPDELAALDDDDDDD